MFAEVECGLVGLASDEGGGEDVATLQKLPHPLSAKSVSHNVAGIIMPLGLALFGLLLSALDCFAVSCIEGHSTVLPLPLPDSSTSGVAQDLVTRVQP